MVYAHNISCWDCMSPSGLEKFLDRDSLSQIVINHGSRGSWIEVAPRSEVKIGQVTLRLIRLLHGCVDNLRRTHLMCEVISCDKRGKGRLHISETFPTVFLNRNMGGCCCCCSFWREKDEWRQLMDTAEKGRLFELRQNHSYQEMTHCTDLNLAINFQTIGPLFQVTPAQTKPKFVWIIGNLRRDKLANQGGRECYIALWRMMLH